MLPLPGGAGFAPVLQQGRRLADITPARSLRPYGLEQSCAFAASAPSRASLHHATGHVMDVPVELANERSVESTMAALQSQRAASSERSAARIFTGVALSAAAAAAFLIGARAS